jgi:hypothetical protein
MTSVALSLPWLPPKVMPQERPARLRQAPGQQSIRDRVVRHYRTECRTAKPGRRRGMAGLDTILSMCKHWAVLARCSNSPRGACCEDCQVRRPRPAGGGRRLRRSPATTGADRRLPGIVPRLTLNIADFTRISPSRGWIWVDPSSKFRSVTGLVTATNVNAAILTASSRSSSRLGSCPPTRSLGNLRRRGRTDG